MMTTEKSKYGKKAITVSSKAGKPLKVLCLSTKPMTTDEKVDRMLKTPQTQHCPLDSIHVLAFSSFPKADEQAVVSRASGISLVSRHSLKSSNTLTSAASLQVNQSIAGTTLALIDAAEKGDSNQVHNLLSKDYFNVDYKRNEDFRTALQRGCQYGHTQVVKELLKAGADPNYSMTSGKTLLHEACVLGHYDIVSLLLEYIEDVDRVDNQGQNACHTAAYHGENQCLVLLAKKGADCTLPDNRGRSPAHLAAQKNHPKILESLTLHGVDIESADENGKRPVHYAAMQGGLECLINLVELDCDTSVRDNSGCVAAHYAAGYNHIDCLRFLVKHGASFETTDASGKTFAHSAAHNGAMTTLHWLFEKGVKTNNQDDNGNTAGHLAVAGGHAKCFNCYLQHGGSLQVTNKRNETVMDIARRFGHPLLMNRACKNEVTCVHCQDKSDMINWEKEHQPTRVQRSITNIVNNSYKTPAIPNVQSRKPTRSSASQEYSTKVKQSKKKEVKLPVRDLATRYFTS